MQEKTRFFQKAHSGAKARMFHHGKIVPSKWKREALDVGGKPFGSYTPLSQRGLVGHGFSVEPFLAPYRYGLIELGPQERSGPAAACARLPKQPVELNACLGTRIVTNAYPPDTLSPATRAFFGRGGGRQQSSRPKSTGPLWRNVEKDRGGGDRARAAFTLKSCNFSGCLWAKEETTEASSPRFRSNPITEQGARNSNWGR